MKPLGQLLSNWRDLIRERNARQWSDEMGRRWIQEGARDIARELECLQKTALIDAVANTQEYTAPADAVRIHRVTYQRDSDEFIYALEYRDFNTMDDVWWNSQTVSRNRPMMYTMWGYPPNLNLVLYPTPSEAGTVSVQYYGLPDELDYFGGDDEKLVQIPQGWDDLAVEYGVYMALRRDADPRWQEALGIYKDRMKVLQEASLRWTDQAGMVSTGMGSVPRFLWDESWDY